ncbi:MAG: hypothetical protein ACI9KN_000440 [Gammaproteobacteria bacterium]|jgi:hypothetical protein
MKLSKFAVIALLPLALCAYQGSSLAADEAKVYIVSPAQGEIVTTPFKVVFGLSGMGVAPAGIDKANTGHHHLLIDTALPDLTRPIPADANHRHFGSGQTEIVMELAPGRHTLQLLLGDFTHTPHNPPVVSEPITITVN